MITKTKTNSTKHISGILGQFQPRWRHRQKHFASSHNQKKENNQFKNKEQPELPEKYLHENPTTKELKKHSFRQCAKTKKYGPNERTNQNSKKRTK